MIEDDEKDRAWLVRTLERAGYAVESVSRGADALALCRERSFDALTLDLLLPDVAGWDVLRQIRSDGPNRDAPVIVVSASAERVAVGFPIHDCLRKPPEPWDLIEALERTGVRPDDSRPVLVVDDDFSALKLARATLEPEGYRVVGTSDAETALRLAIDHRPSVVILDLLMPGMDGFAFLDRFRETEDGRQAVVIVWTVADLTAEDRRRLESSAQSIVSKARDGTDALIEEMRRLAPVRHRARADPAAGAPRGR